MRRLLTSLVGLALVTATVTAQTTAPEPRPESRPAPQPKLVYALMQTSMGDIVIELNNEKAPISVQNFLRYADKEFYDGTIFHRVMDGFMIQGGGLTPDMAKKPTDKPIKNEWRNGLKNTRGSIAMARTAQPDSATAQFYINVVDNPALDRPRSGAAYAVFGRVVAGMDVVDRIRKVDTGMKKGRQNVPIETIVIEKVRPISAEDAQKRIKDKAGSTTKPAE